MAQTVEAYGPGGQNRAEENLRWNRGTIRKGQQELNSGIPADESFSSRGRKKAEGHFPNLLADIKDIVEPKCQTDPTFHTTRLYRPITHTRQAKPTTSCINGINCIIQKRIEFKPYHCDRQLMPATLWFILPKFQANWILWPLHHQK